MIHIFEARFLVFIDDDHWWRKMRLPCFLLNYIIAFCYIIPVYYSMPEQAEAKADILEQMCCVPDYIEFDRVFVFASNTAIPIKIIAYSLGFLALQILIFALWTGKRLRQQIKKSVSRRTVELQVRFQKALILQASLI
ncbi:hypothetical protein B9Z55_017708 [Caenorhabditis nigoni]|uniref:G-protein coupled receptors family 1 profile domain-containing protein n=1 Tax=Caenorhabditis nigoni TaxID=1611254 RepID=A0A2G5TAP1_9PELO|nr:hypothetical protein B9Z55_017708 [Caenorhabditis nigoni]